MHAAESALKTLREFRASLPAATTGAHDTFGHVLTILNDELNTPGALGAIFVLVNRKGGEADLASFDRVMFALGLDLKAAVAVRTAVPAAIIALADKRWAAKQAKDWAGADALRKELTAAGWNMKDGKDGYTLEPLKK